MKNIEEILTKVDVDSAKIQEIVDNIVKPYVEDLDNYVDFIRSILEDGNNPPTAVELDDFIMNLSVFIYYVRNSARNLYNG